MFTKTNHAFG